MTTLYHNGTVIPMTGENDAFEALIERDGLVSYVGTFEEAQALAPDAVRIDLKGRTLMPGFIDPHGHFGQTDNLLIAADFTQCTSIADMQDALRKFIDEHEIGDGAVVMGMNYDHNDLTEKRHPNKFDLDAVSSTIPILAVHVSCHMGAANSAMLELGGIDESTPDPQGARFGRIEGTTEPDGYIEESNALIPLYMEAKKRLDLSVDDLIDGMQEIYSSRGVTTCQEGATTKDICANLTRLAKDGRIKLDIIMYPLSNDGAEGMLRDYEEFDGLDYTGHVRIGGVKELLDGSPQGRTAWMSEPYEPGEEGEGFCSIPFKTDEQVYEFAKWAVDTNHDYLAHANGDAAAEQMLRCYGQAYANSDNPNKEQLRPVMIHCQTTRRDQFERMPALNMIPSMFPSHVWQWGDVHLVNFGQNRGERVSAVRDALDFNLKPTFHTDCPILPPDAINAVWCAVNRLTKHGQQLDEDQKTSVYEALEAITINGAHQYHEEGIKGTLEPGKLADMVILSDNPLRMDPIELRNISIVETIKEGETIYRAE